MKRKEAQKLALLRQSDPLDCSLAAGNWYRRGARLIGGCCRMGPQHIQAMQAALVQ